MTKLIPMQLDDGETLWMEVDESVSAPRETAVPQPSRTRTLRGDDGKDGPAPIPGMERLESVLQGFTRRAVRSLRDVAEANVDKLTLEFGIGIGGETGIPFVTKGKAESSLKVTVEGSFKK
ncbi:CU044_2847 family protein [Endothiovibrio diazotrophicus]